MFRQQRREQFGQDGGVGDALGFLSEHGGLIDFGAGRLRAGARERSRQIGIFDALGITITTRGAQQTHAPIDSAHVVPVSVGQLIGHGKQHAVQDSR